MGAGVGKSRRLNARMLGVLGAGVEHDIPTVCSSKMSLGDQFAGIPLMRHAGRSLSENRQNHDSTCPAERVHPLERSELQRLFAVILGETTSEAHDLPLHQASK